MSEPKRYRGRMEHLHPDKAGMYCLYSDYEKLEALYVADTKRNVAEIHRLRGALEMIDNLHCYGTLGDLHTYKEKVRGYAAAALQEPSDVQP